LVALNSGARVTNGTTTDVVYDRIDVVQEVSGASSADTLIGPDIDEPLIRTDAAGVHGLMSDALGSIIGVTDGTGAVIGEYTDGPFGSTTATGPIAIQSADLKNVAATPFYSVVSFDTYDLLPTTRGS
jgi:hypothetical protein